MTQKLLAQKINIERWIASRPVWLSSVSFANLFLWQGYFDFELKEINDRLCIFASDRLGTFLYFPPLGKDYDRATIAECFSILRAKNHGRGVGRIENVSAPELGFLPEEGYEIYPKGYEYIYYRSTLAALEGNDYKSKRHDYNVFVKKYAADYRPFTAEMKPDCLALYERWAEERRAAYPDPVYGQMLEENYSVHRAGMEFFLRLGLIGRVVIVENKIVAYSFGYPLNRDTFCVIFEVADLSFRGLPVYLFTEFCRDPAVSEFKFINVMDDFGVQNLEQTKSSFRPAVLVPAYTVRERSIHERISKN